MSLQSFSRSQQPFETDDALYIAWSNNNPNGFVFAFTLPDEFYVTLHSASCTHVSRQRSSGAYTRGNYGKHCAETWEDVEQFIARPRARVEECRTCSVLQYHGGRLKSKPSRSDHGSRVDKSLSSNIQSSLDSGTTDSKQTKDERGEKQTYGSPKKFDNSSLSSKDIETVAIFCRSRLMLKEASSTQGEPYQCVPVCVIDAIFSIGVRYESTEAVVRRFCTYFNLPYSGPNPRPEFKEQLSINDFLSIYERYGIERMTTEVYRNRQRTSTSSGILKSDAVLRFGEVLRRHGVNYLQDVDSVIGKQEFEANIMQIPGQRSRISLRYFYMLVGDDNFTKPDRMIQRFLFSALGRDLSLDDCHNALVGAHSLLVNDYPDLTPKSLDHLIWRYQRS